MTASSTNALASHLDTSTPVLVLGGAENSLSVIRSFGRVGVRVSACGDRDHVRKSRFVDEYLRIPADVESVDFYRALLLKAETPRFAGHMLFACGDDSVRFVAEHRAELAERYLLEYNDPTVQLSMLNKLRTLELARDVGIPHPKFVPVSCLDDVLAVRDQLRYPAMIKPFDTHSFRKRLVGAKSYLAVHDAAELSKQASRVLDMGIPFMLSELIPGEDDRACSCYAFFDEQGKRLFSFTKRVLRRYPRNAGGGTYHVIEHLPEVEELGLRFFEGIGYRGLGNVEFKRDERDGRLKIIECNARLTAVQEQIVQAGLDIALVSYRYSTGQPIPPLERPMDGVAFWRPRADWKAFQEVRAATGASYASWVASLRCRKLVFSDFASDDMAPFFHSLKHKLGHVPEKVLRRVRHLVQTS